jgi:class 3 adenylate cyclase
MATQPVTLLFTDLVNSTALLERVGDERAQRVLGAHRQLLREALAGHGGDEVKWLGDGLLATFASVAEAVRCAVTMQQGTRGRTVGERLGLRIGLNVGEMQADGGDYAGSPVVVARRLCERAGAGQILCGGVVVELLRGRQAFQFAALGALELKGFADPLPAYEVVYTPDDPGALRRQAPFTGRTAELARLGQRLEEARAGRGGVVLLAGEPGIGKTRTLEELAERARTAGTLVLWGRCYEGEAARPWGPFAEALGEFVRTAAEETLHGVLGPEAAPLSKLVPAVRARMPELPEPVALEPYEERVRLLDVVTQVLLALAARVPTVLVLDDLHWADPGTVAMLRHVARFAPRGRLLVLGAYRDVEVDRQHPLVEVLGTLPRETSYDQLALAGLDPAAVRTLLGSLTDADVPEGWATILARETRGNPFFLREVVLHLAEEGALGRAGGAWRTVADLDGTGVPETVRQVIERRLGRLGAPARRVLEAAALFTETVRFDIAMQVAELEETAGLNALDEVLAAQLLKSTADPHAYEFTHALVRHTLYGALNPPRRVRLHRQTAEAMEQAYGADAERYAGEIARQYYRSAALPGAERGVPYCLATAEHAERAVALEAVADALAIALALLPADDARRGRLLARRGLALVSTPRASEAAAIAVEAAELVAVSEGRAAAADYLAEVAGSLYLSGTAEAAWAVARHGLTFTEGRRDWTWAVLRGHDLDRMDAEDPDHPGIVLDTPERREIAAFSPAIDRNDRLTHGPRQRSWMAQWGIFESRPAVLTTTGPIGVFRPSSRITIDSVYAQIFWAGAYRDVLPLVERDADACFEGGQLSRAAWGVALGSFLRASLGDLAAAEQELLRLDELERRAGYPPAVVFMRGSVLCEILCYRGRGLEWLAPAAESVLDDPSLLWNRAAAYAYWALLLTFAGRDEDALRAVARAMRAVEQAGGGVFFYTAVICRCCQALWRVGRADFADVLERNLLAKTLAGDFRHPGVDARLAMAQLCALTARPGEAHGWFERARVVLDEQGARPLRALVDLDEAWMEVRRGPHGDRNRARALLDVACEQFQAIGMPGWIERAEALRESVGSASVAVPAPALARDAARASPGTAQATLRREGDYWTVIYSDGVGRLKDMKGLHYLLSLLEHPGHEFHVLDLIGKTTSAPPAERAPSGAVRTSGLPLLDAEAKAAYRRRLGELREDLAEAERFNDAGRSERARAELDAVTGQLAAAVGLAGRDRSTGSGAERARTTVTHGLRAVIERIARQHPGLGDHLAAQVRTGTFCVYQPDPENPVVWELGGIRNSSPGPSG